MHQHSHPEIVAHHLEIKSYLIVCDVFAVLNRTPLLWNSFSFYRATACKCQGLSVGRSVRLSIKRMHCDKTKETCCPRLWKNVYPSFPVYIYFCLYMCILYVIFVLHSRCIIVSTVGVDLMGLKPNPLVVWIYLRSVLWHCWLCHFIRNNPSTIWPIMCLVGH